VGALQHALLDRGAARATSAEASPAFQEVARAEAERRGMAGRIAFELGDFVELADRIPPADLVTLDRVICCYPDMPALVGASAAHARAVWGAVFPRERRLTRFAMGALNLVQRLRRNAFRTYVHPTEGVRQALSEKGFALRTHRETVFWQVMVWRREPAG
jgi:magnesium-protoporphyrin O-methyltransferase